MIDRSSKKQRELLLFIDGFIKGNGYGPSYREVMRALGYKSVSTVAIHIDGLIQKGYLRKKDHSARSIEVVTLQVDSEAGTKETPAALELLEKEIQKRIATPRVKADDVAILIDAAVILGSEQEKFLRKSLADTTQT